MLIHTCHELYHQLWQGEWREGSSLSDILRGGSISSVAIMMSGLESAGNKDDLGLK